MSDRHHRGAARWLGAAMFLAAMAASSYADTLSPTGKVFKCQTDRQIVFSDRPCGSPKESTEIAVSPSNTYRSESAPATVTDSRTKKAAAHQPTVRHSNSIAAEQLLEKQRCQRLIDQLDSIQTKMRTGYSAQQGEQLRERQRQLERKRRTERCR